MTPLARSMMQKGNFIAPTEGSGVQGRITTKDLQPAMPESPTLERFRPGGGEVQTIPVKGVRKVIAQRMLSSMQTTAQLTLNASADARALLDYRKRLKSSSETLGLQKVTINHLILFTVSRTLVQYPDLNALYADDTISQYKNVHLGFAVDTPRGLIVPVIRNANQLSLKQLAENADRLAEACLNATVSPDDLQGGTFTVSNLGSLGIESFTPILNPPQVGILGVGNINLKPVEVEGEVTFIPHISLSLTINHQIVDGAPGARFLQTLSQNLTQLEVLLAL
jgi:pyruvate dehydrogenase E2 component (dihydrolipoamide acetyltransferase)